MGTKRYQSEGHDQSRKGGGKQGRVREEDIKEYINNNSHFILSEMGKYFNMTAIGCFIVAEKIEYWLKK
jgi:hypothetical protein